MHVQKERKFVAGNLKRQHEHGVKNFSWISYEAEKNRKSEQKKSFNIAKEFSLHYFFFAFSRPHFSAFFSFFVELDEILRMKLCESLVPKCESTSAEAIKKAKFFLYEKEKQVNGGIFSFATSRYIKNEWMSLNVEIYFHLNLYFIFTSLWCKTLTMGQSQPLAPPIASHAVCNIESYFYCNFFRLIC